MFNNRTRTRLSVCLSVVVCIALVAGAVPASAGSDPSNQPRSSATGHGANQATLPSSQPQGTARDQATRYVEQQTVGTAPRSSHSASSGQRIACDLYPIALHTTSLVNVPIGGTIPDILNGTEPGNFGWLTWTGDAGVSALVTSLAPPGNASTYVNPDHPADHLVSVGDWVQGRPGVANASNVRTALDRLKTIDISVPVWDDSQASGANTRYHVTDFAIIRLLSYSLPGQNRISARFIGYNPGCGDNYPPSAIADAYSTDEDVTLAVPAPGVLANDSDPNLDPLSSAIVTGTVSGTVTLALDGSFVYTPTASFNGVDFFAYRASDGELFSNTTTVTITVNPVNDLPIAVDDAYEVDQGQVLTVAAPGVLDNDSDLDGDALSAVLASGPAHGALTMDPNGSFIYTPADGFSGSDSFTYRASDGDLESNLATVYLEVNFVGVCRTYTTNADFDAGAYINVVHSVPDQLQLDDTVNAFNFIWVAVSTKGTIVKIDTETGAVLGEYYTSPEGQPKDPSRTTVDLNGNVWATNRAGNSVVHVGLGENNQCVDRNGNGQIDTSTGLNDVLPWTNAGGADTNGGVSTAADECILHYVRVSSSGTRHVAVTADNDVWISGTGNRIFNLLDGGTGQIIRTEGPVGYGGYGGLIDGNGVIWSANPMLRWDTSRPLSGPNGGTWRGYSHDSYGLCIDSHGNVWNTSLYGNQIRKFAPDGTQIGVYGHGYNSAQGCAVDQNDDVWVAHVLWGSATVGHLKNNGTFVGNVPVPSGPTGVAVDAAGKIWSTNYNTRNVSRIDPNAGPIGADGVTHVGAVDFTSWDLGGNLYNYSDMTGSTLTGAPGSGAWTVDYDSGLSDAEWGTLSWAADVFGDGALAVTAASSEDGVTFSPPVLAANGGDLQLPDGPFLRINVSFSRAASGESPILYDLTSCTAGATPTNSRPVAVDDAFAADENQTLTVPAPGVLANDSDGDGDPLTAVLVTDVANGVLTLSADGSFAYTPNTGFSGSDSFTYRATDGNLDSNTATVNITVSPVNDPPVANDDGAITGEDTPVTIDVVANDTDADGNLDPASATATASPAHGTLVNNGDGTFTYTPALNTNGADSFTYQVCDTAGACDGATVAITVNPVNDPPVVVDDGYAVNAGQVLTVPAPGVLDNDTDVDGDALTAVQVSDVANGVLTLNANGAFAYTPNAGFTGGDSFTYRASDGSLESNLATVSLQVSLVNASPVANDDGALTDEDTPVTIDVVANDTDADGNLDPASATATSSPAHGTLVNNGDGTFTYTPALNTNGADSFTYQVCDTAGACDSATVSITVNPVNDPPVAVNDGYSVNAGQVLTVAAPGVLGNDSDVDGNPLSAVLNTGVAHGALTLNADGSFIYTPTAGFTGSDSFTYQAFDGSLNSNIATATIGVVGAPPTSQITSPTEGTEVTAPVNVVGTANSTALASWTLEYRLQDDPAWTAFATGNSPVVNGVLGSFDPTLLLNGMYEIRLTTTDLAGRSAIASVNVVVKEDLKVGNFSISFTDLEIPVVGLPIQVIRTYDSRDKRTGDFGVGWTLSLQDVRLQENGVTGEDWQVTVSGGFFPTYCVVQTKPHVVSITLPDGTVHKFEPVLNPACQVLFPIQFATVGFRPLSGSFGSLAAIGNTDVIVSNPGGGATELWDLDSFLPYDANQYQQTTQDGRVLNIDQFGGLQSLTDTNGNTVTITNNGIIHSAGKSVVFSRDGQNRITQITDPMGNTIGYGYDARGDLANHTDQVGNATQFTYNNSHGLLDIVDPRGITPARNEYDDDGRLIATIDADGNRIEFTHDLGARQEVVRDRLGNVTVYGYDQQGNVVAQTDALGNTTAFTYDSRGNKLSETDPLGNTTTFTYDARDNVLTQRGPLGNQTTYTYDSRNQILTTTDPLGNTTTNTYDANGRLVTVTDGLGNTTSYTYDSRGNLTSITDALGYTTTYSYDANGNRISETDALGTVTTYVYDANGNLLVTTTSRTDLAGNTYAIVTTNQYDGLNRVVRTVDAEGHASTVEYNAIGQKSADVDRNGHRTQYEYDSRGNLIRTIFPDGTQETATHDANSNRLTLTDRAGHTTQYVYDDLSRLVQVTYADGSTTEREYDAAGNLTAVVDENGNRTSYGYDTAGRNTTVTDALGNVTTYTYLSSVYAADEADVASITDANGHTTSFEYDDLGRRTRTIYPNGTVASTVYDALGRKLTETDQGGTTVHYGYDALDRLTTVTDALGNTLGYSYDEAGNKLTQTDANSHATQWSYNNLGLVTSHTLPLGMIETYSYDANGNIVRTTDFNGDAITFTYDKDNRLLTKTYEDGSQISYTYTSTGKRATVSDDRGFTSYAYDVRDRLVGVTNPDATTLAYSYDAVGNRTSVATPSGTTTKAYDALNRLSSVTDPDGGVTTYSYDAVGNRATVAYPNNTVTSYTYDTLNRLVYLENSKLPGQIISSYIYTLGATGNRLRVVENTGRTVNYTYDSLYRLIEESIVDPTAGSLSIAYAYDAAGNRLSKTDGTSTTIYTYDTNDRLLNEGGNSYTYDANGNTLSRTNAADTTIYTYNFENRLTSVQMAGGVIAYDYDADGIRTQSIVNGVATDYLVDTNQDYAQVLEERDGTGAVVATYIYGDDLINQRREGTGSYYHYDGLGSTRVLTDGGSNITDTYTYEAFGLLLAFTGTTVNHYRFTGEQFDPNIGFYYLRARYYAPDLGRFITTDPFPGLAHDPLTLHKYLYTSADPVNRIDPSGNFSLVSIAITSSIIGILSGILAYAFTGSLRTAVIVGVSVFVLSFMTLGLISALTAGTAGTVVTGAGTATIPAAPRLLNPTTWQQAERLLSQVLTVAKNTQSFFVRGMSQARIPDFVVQGRYIADSKFVQTLTQTAQLRDFAVLAQNMNVPMYVFVRANTYVTGPVLQLIRSTGGDVIRIFH